MGVGITKWNITISSVYTKLVPTKFHIMYEKKIVYKRQINFVHNFFSYTVKLPNSVNPVSTPLPMKDEGAVGSGQLRFIYENFLSCPGLHRFYKNWKRQTRQDRLRLNRPADRTCQSHRLQSWHWINGVRQFHSTIVYWYPDSAFYSDSILNWSR